MAQFDFKYFPTTGEDEHLYCIDDFIKDLERISPDKRKLPLMIFSPNGLQWKPTVKMVHDNTYAFEEWDDIFGKLVAMAISY